MRGAGGSEGGIARFILGLVMMVAGIYLLLNNIRVDGGFGGFGMGRQISFGGYAITSGYVMIPFMFGIGMIFYNSRNYFGWFLSIASLVMLIVGVITSINFRFNYLSAFELIIILILFIGGIGLFLSSLRSVRGGGATF